MKHLLFPILAMWLALSAAAGAAPIRYAVDTEQSVVELEFTAGRRDQEFVSRMRISDFDVVLDFENVTRSRVAVTIDVDSARSTNPIADRALRSQEVLWVERYPEAFFTTRRVTTDGQEIIVDGDITIRGVTRPVTFRGQIYRQQGTQAGDRDRMAIHLGGLVNRTDFGAQGWLGHVSNDVRMRMITRLVQVE